MFNIMGAESTCQALYIFMQKTMTAYFFARTIFMGASAPTAPMVPPPLCSEYHAVSPTELDQVLQDIKRDHPNDGEVLLQGHLLGLGIRVPHSQLRASIHRVDHE